VLVFVKHGILPETGGLTPRGREANIHHAAGIGPETIYRGWQKK
jgi:hypothetical protein